VIGTAREGKPREIGLTMVSDHLQPVGAEFLEQTAEYVDYVKIGLSLPLMVERSRLTERIRRYHDFGIKVASGGTLVEVAVQKGITAQMLEGLSALKFDMVEISELSGAMPVKTKREIIDSINEFSMDYVIEVDVSGRQGMASGVAISRVQDAMELKSKKVVIDVGDGVAGRYDGQQDVPWDMLNEVAGTFGPPNLIFEMQNVRQMVAMVLEFGPSVNLAGVPMDEALVLEMHRQGLTPETLGLSRPPQDVGGSPAAKFVYHLIRTEHPIDQPTLSLRSGLPKRTIQAALKTLVVDGLVREVSDTSDLRKRRYTVR
jgi:phosphosulfolactate synthase (CoM biosynthesis protein A)